MTSPSYATQEAGWCGVVGRREYSVPAFRLVLLAVFAAWGLVGCANTGYAPYDDYRYEEARTAKPRKTKSRRSTRATRSKSNVSTAAAKASKRTKRSTSAVALSTPKSKPRPAASRQPAAPPAAQSAATVAQAPVKPEPPQDETDTRRAAPGQAAAADDREPPPTVAAAAAPPGNSGPTPAIPDAAVETASRKQLAEGYRLLRAGFVRKARERFESAMAGVPAEATLANARSLDPTYLKSIAFPDGAPDTEQARKLYRRAILLGSSEAKGDLERLDRSSSLPQAAPARP